MKLTLHFDKAEFACRDGTPLPPGECTKNAITLCRQLEVLRTALGNKVITITSGYRTPAHNKRVGGKAASLHLKGAAADIRVDGVAPAVVHAKIEELIAAKKMLQGGLGLYTRDPVQYGWVHYDLGPRRRWRG